ncbi:MAG: phospholipid/cholesterol/gamma-HCH transport system substrate-binding protein [Abditibacteriota bacterium]|nr:phospholipid/cholesterol/gamma-HCH transport system substrate-binding protein [Abditibacteriota bacterium]
MRVANEVRVGIVVVLALTLMLSAYFFLRGVGFGAELYYVRLNSAATIAAGNDVRLQGVKVGQVQEVTLDPQTQKPLLTLAIKRQQPAFKLLQNYRYSVQSSAVIGESYVDIRGDFDPNAPVYSAGNPAQIIPGTGSAGIAGITDQATLLAQELRSTLQKFNVTIDRVNKGVLSYENQTKLARTLDNVTRLSRDVGQAFGPQGIRFGFGDPRAQRGLNEALINTAALSRQAQGLARDAQSVISQANVAARNVTALTASGRDVVQENRGQLRRLLTTFDRTAQNVAGLTETLDFALRQGGFKENAQIAFQSLRRSAENVEAATAGFRALTSDPQAQNDLRTTLTALRESTEALRATAQTISGAIADPQLQGQLKTTLQTLSATAATLQTTTENLRVASEGLKNIAGDSKVQEDIKALPAELRGTLVATRATAERVNALLGGRRNRNAPNAGGTTPGTLEPPRSGYVPGGFDFTYRHFADGATANGIRSRNFGDITFNAELFGSPFRAGLANIGEGTDLTLQTGRFLGKNGALRYGLYRSKLGVGADYRAGRFSIEGNLYDPARRSMNIYGGVRLTPEIEIIAGREHGRGVRTNSIGVRLTP